MLTDEIDFGSRIHGEVIDRNYDGDAKTSEDSNMVIQIDESTFKLRQVSRCLHDWMIPRAS